MSDQARRYECAGRVQPSKVNLQAGKLEQGARLYHRVARASSQPLTLLAEHGRGAQIAPDPAVSQIANHPCGEASRPEVNTSDPANVKPPSRPSPP